MDIYKTCIKPVLFKLNPDFVHEMITTIGEIGSKTVVTRYLLQSAYDYQNPKLETTVFGLSFKNPVGIAGGFDKDCKLIETLPLIGFGFTEVGSITAKPYEGNERPWNIRLIDDQSILVNYGLKNKGAKVLKEKIRSKKRKVPLIINIAKTNDPTIKGSDSFEDYYQSLKLLLPEADIINLNISCPNTGDGTLFCESPTLLKGLLDRLSKEKISKPIVLKIKPDLNQKLLKEIILLSISYPFIKGFILSNLTKNRDLIKKVTQKKIEQNHGGLSGKPVQKLSDEMIKNVYQWTKGKYPIIGLGGIFTAEDAYRKICLGASLVELATGMIFQGPATIKRINKGLVTLLEKDGYTTISQAVGSKNKIKKNYRVE